MNNWKARITERLVECYIKENIIPSLKKKRWDDVIYTSGWFSGERSEDSENPFTEYEGRAELRILVGYGFFPSEEFLKRFKQLTSLLENIPDGFLIKLKRTGMSKSREGAIKEHGLRFEDLSFTHYFWGTDIFGSRHYMEMFIRPQSSGDELLPVVNGDVEVVEIKSDRATLPPNQKKSYSKVLREGYVLHFFHVNIVSFEKNEFEIEEKLLTSPNQLKTFRLKKRDSKDSKKKSKLS
jgi:hypothetical protein